MGSTCALRHTRATDAAGRPTHPLALRAWPACGAASGHGALRHPVGVLVPVHCSPGLSSLPLHCMDDAGCARATWHWLLPTPGGRCSPELRLPLQAAGNDSAPPLLVGGTRVTCRVLRQLRQHHLAYHGVACCAGVRCCSSYGRWRTIHRYAVAGRPRHVSSSQCRPWPAKALALGALATP